jgi:hypothetical protein
MTTRKIIGALIAVELFAIALVYAALTASVTVSSRASVKAIGIKADVNSIDWGLIEPGSSVNQVVRFNATGNVPVTLSFYTGNWQPGNAQQYMKLSWNYTGATLRHAVIPVQFTLFVNSSVANITDFSFDITVVAAG